VKFLIGIALALGISFAAYAAAASVNVNGGALQQGTDSNLKCTNDVDVDFENIFGLGNADIVVTGFNANCIGARFYLEFLNSGGSELASCPPNAGSEPTPPGGILITGASVTLTVAGGDCELIPIGATEQIRVTIVGGGDTP
jgi:hypothetical protein